MWFTKLYCSRQKIQGESGPGVIAVRTLVQLSEALQLQINQVIAIFQRTLSPIAFKIYYWHFKYWSNDQRSLSLYDVQQHVHLEDDQHNFGF